MQNVVVHRIAGAQHAVGENVRVRIAALAGNRVDRFDVLRAQVVENFADQADGFVLAHAGLHGAVQLVVGGVDHHRRDVQQRDFVLRLDHARVGHQLLAVDDLDSFSSAARTGSAAR